MARVRSRYQPANLKTAESATHYTRVSAEHLKTTSKSLIEMAESKGLAK